MLNLLITVSMIAGAWAADAGKDQNDVQYPDPKRWTGTIRTFEEWDSKNSFPSNAVLFVGSSSIRLWPTAKAFGGEYPVINRGFGGSYMADSVYYINELVLQYSPKVVVVFAGTNDIAGNIPAARVHRDFIALVEAIHKALPQTEIIYMPITPTQSRWHLWSKMQEVDVLNKNFAAGKEFVTFVDVASAFLGTDGQPAPELFVADQLHLSGKGYAKWNTALAPVLRTCYNRVMEKDYSCGSCKAGG